MTIVKVSSSVLIMKSFISSIKPFFCNKLSFSLFLILSLLYLIICIRPPLSDFPYQKKVLKASDWAGLSQKNCSKTSLRHIVFGIGSTGKLWHGRKNYTRIWWKPQEMRGFVWIEKNITTKFADHDKNDLLTLPPIKISSDAKKFKYKHRKGNRSAIRLSRIILETVKMGMPDVRWYVMADDDTFFVPENLVRVLEKLDHNQFYYIGGNSETHRQNIDFSYDMAFGGGGFAVSYALANVLAKMEDPCLQRYPTLYGSDDRIQACMAELGVPLTKHSGFHQCDVFGDLFGLLSAHPVTPFVSLHHLDLAQPIFPNVTRVQALTRLTIPMKVDAAALLQQSICYNKKNKWTVSISWGYAVQIFHTIIYARELQRPARTFETWYRSYKPEDYAFNTRPNLGNDPCGNPSVYYMSNAVLNSTTNRTQSTYLPHPTIRNSRCTKLKQHDDPSFVVKRVEVFKTPDPNLWSKSPRRNCCRIMKITKNGTLVLDVGPCGKDEFGGL